MPTISQSLELQDNVTNRFNRMSRAADELIGRFASLDTATDNLDMPSQFAQANATVQQIADSMERLVEITAENGNQLNQMNEQLSRMNEQSERSKGSWDGVGGAIKAAVSFLSVQKVKQFVDEVFKLNGTQIKAEVQLATVMNNQGLGMDAFEQIKQRASQLQGTTMYGDEAMISGAAELSTYISDAEAISSMMGTLANYAAGMSGGGEVDTAAMTEYATQLGKALDGTYDGLKKKGFDLSEEQKKIIENGTDMEKALVLDEVISQSWENLAANMRSTPTGMITSLNNTLGDIGETIGARLTPKFMELAEASYEFITSSGAEAFISDIVSLLNAVFEILEWGLGILQTAADYWDTIKVVLIGAAAAFLVYEITTNGAAIATSLATAAQKLFNAALGASPIFWVVAAVTALCAALAFYTDYVNKAYGLSLSFAGMLGGVLMTALAALGNMFLWIGNVALGCWNGLEALGQNIYVVFHNAISGVKEWWYDLLSTVLNVVAGICEALNKIPFIEFDYSGITSAANNYAAQAAKESGNKLEYVDMGEAFSKGMDTLDYIDYGEAFDAGYYMAENAFGAGAADNSPFEFDYESLFSGPTGTADDPIHTNVDNDVNIADEDLKLLRDIAEARFVQNFVTLTPTVQVSGNTINEKADVNALIDEIEYRLETEIATSAEGVYG